MSAFAKLQNYSAKYRDEKSDVFDVKTPLGAYYDRVHKNGLAMYKNVVYKLKDEYKDEDLVPQVTDFAYNLLSEEDKNKYQLDSYKFTELYNVLNTDGSQVVNAIAGSGKALVDTTQVLTTNGWVKICDITTDSKVFGADGKPHKVIGVFPQGKHTVYRITFNNNKTIECNGEHIWTVKSIYTDEAEDITTAELLAENPNTFYVQPTKPVTNKKKYDGYELGYLYGVLKTQGYSKDITKNLIEIASVSDIQAKKLMQFYADEIVLSETDENRIFYKNYTTNKALTQALHNHFVSVALNSSIEFKQGVIAAITDSGLVSVEDGAYALRTVCGNAVPKIYLCFARALGLIGTFKKDAENSTIKVTVAPNKQFTTLSDCFNNEAFIQQSMYLITRVEKTDYKKSMTCISIDSEDKLYLTEDFIPTHNTTMMIAKIQKDIATGECMTLKTIPNGETIRIPDKVWVCTFLRSGALELQQSLRDWEKKLGYTIYADSIVFSTLDAEFKRCLESMGAKVNIGEPAKLNSLLRKAINSCGIKRNNTEPLNSEDYNTISSIVAYARGRLDDTKYKHPDAELYGLLPNILDLLITQYANLRQIEGIVDFDEISELLYKYLYTEPNSHVQDYVSNRYNFIYIDEFQDTSQLQYAILKFYARGKLKINRDNIQSNDILYTGAETKGKIVLIGDPSQTIYSFRGSDSNIIAHNVYDDFDPVRSTLSYNWRCPANILNPIVPSIHLNKDSANQQILPNKKGGEFYAYEFISYQRMLEQLVKDIDIDIANNRSVAVLCRTNYEGTLPAISLEKARFNYAITSKNMTLDSGLPRSLINIASLFTQGFGEAIKKALKLLVYDYNGVELLTKTLANSQTKSQTLTIWDLPMADIEHSCPLIAKFVEAVKPYVLDENEQRTSKSEVTGLKAVYSYMIANTFKRNSAYAESARAYLETLIYLIEENDFNSVYDFQEEVEYLNDKLKARLDRKKYDIQITTVHEYKGKEADSVYIWNDSIGQFPSSRCNEEDKEQLEEERRIHYIACTRAKQVEHIYTLYGKHGRFFDEMDLKVTNPNKVSVKLNKAEDNFTEDDGEAPF